MVRREILDEPNVDPVKAYAFAKLGDVIVVEKSRGGVGRRYRQRSGREGWPGPSCSRMLPARAARVLLPFRPCVTRCGRMPTFALEGMIRVSARGASGKVEMFRDYFRDGLRILFLYERSGGTAAGAWTARRREAGGVLAGWGIWAGRRHGTAELSGHPVVWPGRGNGPERERTGRAPEVPVMYAHSGDFWHSNAPTSKFA